MSNWGLISAISTFFVLKQGRYYTAFFSFFDLAGILKHLGQVEV
tara:strand:- start:392 stop:523 length:132 start_codon:yes stop_codon:yes gene_type:complete